MKHRGMSRASALTALAGSLALPLAVRAQSALPLTLGSVPEDTVTSALYADQSGLFQKYGLAVTIVSERSGSAIASGVAGGAFQIAKSSLPGLVVAFSKGVPFQLVAAAGIYSATAPNAAIIIKADSPIKTAADLNGKTLAVSALNDICSVSTREWMEKNGGSPDTIKMLEFPVTATPEAIVNNRVDAGCVIEPTLQRGIESGKVKEFAHQFDAIAPRFLYTAWFATADWVKDHTKEVVGFNQALHDASIYANAHRAQTIDMLSKNTSMDPAIIAKMVRAELGTTLDPKLIQPVINACAKYKLISAVFDAKDLIATPLR